MYAGKLLRQLRLKHDVNQEDMAVSLGLSRSYYAAVETGKRKISKKMIEKINEKWGVEQSYWLKSDGKTMRGNIEGVSEGVDVKKLSHSEIIELYQHGDFFKLPEEQRIEIGERLKKSIEKQKVIAEKYFSTLPQENPEFNLFRKSILAIQSFQNILDNLKDSDTINSITKIDSAAVAYSETSYLDFKKALNVDIDKVRPYFNDFINFANSLNTFVIKLKEMPDGILDIDKGEFSDFIELNS